MTGKYQGRWDEEDDERMAEELSRLAIPPDRVANQADEPPEDPNPPTWFQRLRRRS